MTFDFSKTWQDALSAVSANRDVMFPVAGVFFLIPAVAQAFFMSDLQAQIFANLMNPEAMEAAMEGQMGTFVGFSFLAGLVQLVGYLALMALLTDRTRPTVGDALFIAVRSLPTLIGAVVLFVVGYVAVAAIFSLLAGGLVAATGSTAIGAIPILGLIAFIFYFVVKLSLTLPVVVIERVMNPVTALLRSWQLTKGNSVRLFLFYLLLTIAYIVIAVVFMLAVMAPLALVGDIGKAGLVIAGLLSGIIGAITGVLFAAILASIHRQLAGPSTESVSSTFE